MRRLGVVVLLLSAIVASCTSEPEELSGFVREPLPSVADVTLPDASNGAPFEMKAAPGELLLVYFGYTYCPDVCPTTLAELKKMYAEIGDTGEKVTTAMVTVDIARDTEDSLVNYVQSFLPTGHGIRPPDEDTLREAADAFGADYAIDTLESVENYDVVHTAHVYAVDDAGLIQVTWAFGTEWDVMAKDIKILLGRT
ncbi:MAG: SCO family protein [bacterium]|nr:SCO family protein [bacterium]